MADNNAVCAVERSTARGARTPIPLAFLLSRTSPSAWHSLMKARKNRASACARIARKFIAAKERRANVPSARAEKAPLSKTVVKFKFLALLRSPPRSP